VIVTNTVVGQAILIMLAALWHMLTSMRVRWCTCTAPAVQGLEVHHLIYFHIHAHAHVCMGIAERTVPCRRNNPQKSSLGYSCSSNKPTAHICEQHPPASTTTIILRCTVTRKAGVATSQSVFTFHALAAQIRAPTAVPVRGAVVCTDLCIAEPIPPVGARAEDSSWIAAVALHVGSCTCMPRTKIRLARSQKFIHATAALRNMSSTTASCTASRVTGRHSPQRDRCVSTAPGKLCWCPEQH
jgi:hypothetical protein